MILEKKEDKKGPFYKLGMLERATLTLENYASSEIGPRFYTEEFLSGIATQRNALHARVAKATSSLIVVTTLLAFYDNIQGTTSIAEVSISLPQAGAAALCVVIAMSLFGLIIGLIDQIMIDRYIATLGERLGVYSFELALLNYSAQNLWVSAILPKYFGLKSDTGHKTVAPVFGLFFVVFSFAGLTYPVAVISSVAWPVLSDPSNLLEVALVLFSISMLLFSLFIILAFSLRYKFRPTGTSEPENPFIPEDFLDHGHPRIHKTDADSDTLSEKSGRD